MIPLIGFAVALPLGAMCMAVHLALRYRRVASLRPPELPLAPTGRLVLPGSGPGRALSHLWSAGIVLWLLALLLASGSRQLYPLAVAVVVAAAIGFILLATYVEGRTASRLEVDEDGFTLAGRGLSRHVRWIHLTELRVEGDVIRFRVNRALVGGPARRYWDGAIRNRWGVDTGQLLRLLERYRVRAMDQAPHFLTGRAERSR